MLESHKFELGKVLDMTDLRLESNVSLSKYGDVDLIVRGVDVSTQKDSIAVIEVKTNRSLLRKYFKYQLLKYIQRFSDAKQFVVYSREKSFRIEDLVAVNAFSRREINFV